MPKPKVVPQDQEKRPFPSLPKQLVMGPNITEEVLQKYLKTRADWIGNIVRDPRVDVPDKEFAKLIKNFRDAFSEFQMLQKEHQAALDVVNQKRQDLLRVKGSLQTFETLCIAWINEQYQAEAEPSEPKLKEAQG